MDEYQFYKNICDNDYVEINQLSLDAKEKLIEQLIAKGLELENKNNKLVSPSPMSYCDKNKILNNFPESLKSVNLETHYQLGSTNSSIKEVTNSASVNLLIAEYQSDGRGRRGNQWISPLGNNLYFSIKFTHIPTKNLSLYPIFVSIILAEFLVEYGVSDVAIKWPNDLYIKGEKSMGLMLELHNTQESNSLILGIGINLFQSKQNKQLMGQKVTGLYEHTNRVELTNKNTLLSLLLPKLILATQNYDSISAETIVKRFKPFNWLNDREIEIKEKDMSLFGHFLKLNNDGSLSALIDNEEKSFYSADVSIRA